MKETKSRPQAPYHSKTLTDDEYKQLVKQIEHKEKHSLNDDEHIRATSERQVNKFYFIAGNIVGAGVLFLVLVLFGAVNL